MINVPDERQGREKEPRANKRDKRRTSERAAEEAKRAAHQNNLIMKELYMKTTLP